MERPLALFLPPSLLAALVSGHIEGGRRRGWRERGGAGEGHNVRIQILEQERTVPQWVKGGSRHGLTNIRVGSADHALARTGEGGSADNSRLEGPGRGRRRGRGLEKAVGLEGGAARGRG
jgi:hypothetical protein